MHFWCWCFSPEERAAGVWHDSSYGQVNVARLTDAATHTVAQRSPFCLKPRLAHTWFSQTDGVWTRSGIRLRTRDAILSRYLGDYYYCAVLDTAIRLTGLLFLRIPAGSERSAPSSGQKIHLRTFEFYFLLFLFTKSWCSKIAQPSSNMAQWTKEVQWELRECKQGVGFASDHMIRYYHDM